MEKGKNPFDTSPISQTCKRKKKMPNQLVSHRSNDTSHLRARYTHIFNDPDVRNKKSLLRYLPRISFASPSFSSIPSSHRVISSSSFFVFYSFLIFSNIPATIYSWTDTSCQGCINNNPPHPCIGIVAPIAQHSNRYDSYQSIERS